jgi:hypothetical protein
LSRASRRWRNTDGAANGVRYVHHPVDPIPFEVELVVTTGRPLVFARQLVAASFMLSNSAKLGGCAIVPVLSAPRALQPDGSPRMDLVAFVLQSRGDLSCFREGQRVLLEP